MNLATPRQVLLLLQLSAVCVFAGRAWQHFFWEAPYRELLWDEGLLRPIVEKFTSLSWQEYVSNLAVDGAVHRWMLGLGIFYTLCAFLSLFITRISKYFRIALWLGAGSLFLLALLYMKEHFFHAGQFFEYALQFGTPVFLLLASSQRPPFAPLLFWMKAAIALTFACHGLYALGYYPRPGNYTEMTMVILGVSEPSAIKFLLMAGIFDFLVAAGVFLPWRWARWVLIYATCWGLATSAARVVGNFYWDHPWQSLHEWVFQTAYRLPHSLIPFTVFVWWKIKKQTCQHLSCQHV